MLIGTSVSFAADSISTSPDSVATSKKAIAAKRKAQANVKQVNINAATRDELKTLPGIGDAEADKIIAGRPYGSKGGLASNNVLPMDKALAIRDLVFAGKPNKAGAKKSPTNTPKK